MVSLLLICPLRPMVFSSPPPWFCRFCFAACWAPFWVSCKELALEAASFLFAHFPSFLRYTDRSFLLFIILFKFWFLLTFYYIYLGSTWLFPSKWKIC